MYGVTSLLIVGTDTLFFGDCINTSPETGFVLAELVSCENDWEFRVANIIDLPEGDTFPVQDFMMQASALECDRIASTNFSPTSETWSKGHRKITCLQDSYGLAVQDPERLARLVGTENLREGECSNEAPETFFEMSELVRCSGDWDYQLLNSFEVSPDEASPDGSFPGDAYIADQAANLCDESYDFYISPNAETWQSGDRAVVCYNE